MDDRKEGAEGTDDQGLNEILKRLDALSRGGAVDGDRRPWATPNDAAAFIRTQHTKLENAEIVLRAARQALEKGAYHNAAIHMIDGYIGDRPGAELSTPLGAALVELRRLVKVYGD